MKILELMMVLVLLVMQPVCVYANEITSDIVLDRTEGTIYVGDSRFNGMEMHLKKGDGYVVAKDSMGYKWLVTEALPAIENIKATHTDITEWTIVSGLGVNDLYNIDNYIQVYKNLEAAGYRVVALSVNPTNHKRVGLNEEINVFNFKLSQSGLEYFDLNRHLLDVGFDTVDGLHYKKATYQEIWNEINWYLTHQSEENKEYDWMCLN